MSVTTAYQQYVPRAGNLDPTGDGEPVPDGRLPALSVLAHATVGLPAPVGRAPDPSTTLGLYPFDGDGYDLSGQHDATVVGSPSYGTACGGIPGLALLLNGSSQYARVAGLLDDPSGGFAIGFRYRPATSYATGTARLVTKFWSTSLSPVTNILDVHLIDGGLTVRLYANSASATDLRAKTAPVASGTNYDVVISLGPGGYQLWINGVLEGWTPEVPLPAADGTEQALSLGAYWDGSSASNFFQGAIDDVWVRSGEALPEEVAAFHAAARYTVGQAESGRWASVTRRTLLSPSGGTNWDADAVLEPTNTVLLSDGTTRIAAYTGFRNATQDNAIGLVTVTLDEDGEEVWTRRGSAPVVGLGHGGESADANGPWLMKVAGRIYLYYVPGYGSTDGVKLATSDDDGATWTNRGVVLAGGGWSPQLANPAVTVDPDSGLWLMLLSGVADSLWQTGLARSTNGTRWTQDPRNPLTSGSLGGLTALRSFARVGGRWRCWGHFSVVGANLPTNLARWDSDDLYDFSPAAPAGPFMFPLGETVNGSAPNQRADPAVEQDGGRVRLRNDVCLDEGLAGFHSYIQGASWEGTLEALVSDSDLTALLR